MKKILSVVFTVFEWSIPVLGISRLGAGRAASVVLASAAHLVPILGCALAGWDPVIMLLAYWIEIAVVALALVLVMAMWLLFRLAGMKVSHAGPGFTFPDRILRGGPGNRIFFFLLWTAQLSAFLAVNLKVLGGIAQSHYSLETLAASLQHLMHGFLPPGTGIVDFLNSESASLALMVVSGIVSLGFHLSGRGGSSNDAIYVFMAKPLVRIMAMSLVLGCAMAFSSYRLPALATVIVMALAMALIDQRVELIGHDYASGKTRNARFATPQGALVNFGLSILIVIVSAHFLVSYFYSRHMHYRVLKNPAVTQGVIIHARSSGGEGDGDASGMSRWIVDARYATERDPSRSHILREIAVQLPSAADPNGLTVRILHEASEPRNAFADTPEEQNIDASMLVYGIILLVLGLPAKWAIARIFHD